MNEAKKSWVLRIKSKEIMEAREILLTTANEAVIKAMIKPDGPEKVTNRQIDEYIYALGMRLAVEEIKEVRFRERQSGLSNVNLGDANAITKDTLIAALRERGYDKVADQMSGEKAVVN